MTNPTCPVYSANHISHAIIRIFNIKGESITHLQLQKLLYLAHGWCLAIYDRPLLKCEIENWKHGPIVGEIFHKFKVFGQDPVKMTITDQPSLDNQTRSLLDKIYEVYGKMNGIKLSSMSHVTGSPWDQTKNKSVIDDKIIAEWFKNKASHRMLVSPEP